MNTETMTHSPHKAERTKELGRQLTWGARLAALPILFIPLLRWWLLSDASMLMPASLAGSISTFGLSFQQRLAGTLVDALVYGVAISALFVLARLGKRFYSGKGITMDTAKLQLQLGRRLLWLAIIDFFYTPVVTLAVTLFNPPGGRMLTVTITGGEFMLLIAALVVFLFGRITEEATCIAEENAQIV